MAEYKWEFFLEFMMSEYKWEFFLEFMISENMWALGGIRWFYVEYYNLVLNHYFFLKYFDIFQLIILFSRGL